VLVQEQEKQRCLVSQCPPIVRLPIGRRDIPQPVLLPIRQIHIRIFTSLEPQTAGSLLESLARRLQRLIWL
jgi:hypothetical protein